MQSRSPDRPHSARSARRAARSARPPPARNRPPPPASPAHAANNKSPWRAHSPQMWARLRAVLQGPPSPGSGSISDWRTARKMALRRMGEVAQLARIGGGNIKTHRSAGQRVSAASSHRPRPQRRCRNRSLMIARRLATRHSWLRETHVTAITRQPRNPDGTLPVAIPQCSERFPDPSGSSCATTKSVFQEGHVSVVQGWVCFFLAVSVLSLVVAMLFTREVE